MRESFVEYILSYAIPGTRNGKKSMDRVDFMTIKKLGDEHEREEISQIISRLLYQFRMMATERFAEISNLNYPIFWHDM